MDVLLFFYLQSQDTDSKWEEMCVFPVWSFLHDEDADVNMRREQSCYRDEHLTPLAPELFRQEWTTSITRDSHYLLAEVDLGKGACFQMYVLCSDFWFKNFFKCFFHDCSKVWPSLYKHLKNSESRNTLKILWVRHLLLRNRHTHSRTLDINICPFKTPNQLSALKSSLWKDPSLFLRIGIVSGTEGWVFSTIEAASNHRSQQSPWLNFYSTIVPNYSKVSQCSLELGLFTEDWDELLYKKENLLKKTTKKEDSRWMLICKLSCFALRGWPHLLMEAFASVLSGNLSGKRSHH